MVCWDGIGSSLRNECAVCVAELDSSCCCTVRDDVDVAGWMNSAVVARVAARILSMSSSSLVKEPYYLNEPLLSLHLLVLGLLGN